MTYFVAQSDLNGSDDIIELTVGDRASAYGITEGRGAWIAVYLRFIYTQCQPKDVEYFVHAYSNMLNATAFYLIDDPRLRKRAIEFSNKYYTRWRDEYVDFSDDCDETYNELRSGWCEDCEGDCGYAEDCGVVRSKLYNLFIAELIASVDILETWWDLMYGADLDRYYAHNSAGWSAARIDARYVGRPCSQD